MLCQAEPVETASDYDHVRRAIAFISESWREQPPLEAIADHVGLSASHMQHVFTRWAGLSPKAFVQAITLNHARALLRESASILDAARLAQVKIPTLCKHKDLLPTAACGICIVRNRGSNKMIRACATPLENGMETLPRTLREQFVAAGFGVERHEVMYNDYVIVGPASDAPLVACL